MGKICENHSHSIGRPLLTLLPSQHLGRHLSPELPFALAHFTPVTVI